MPEDRAANHAAYRRLKDEIARAYEQGRFVAIASGRIVADAENFYELRLASSPSGKTRPRSSSFRPAWTIRKPPSCITT